MEKRRKRPPAALKLGGIPAEHSWNVLLRAESNQPANQRPPCSNRRRLHGGGYHSL